ncbi:transcription repressor OFP8-like [Andrographis paniculata]|uniref:transcription repressor OFP8-like n=1 Tax=Andrographis paniculata TaxID=175694 RepID=UPI0021E81B2C|nr:transcription repressor OFP8-like [Andrographis paniculata]
MTPRTIVKFKGVFAGNGGCGCDSTAATDIIEPTPKSRNFSDRNLVAAANGPSSSESSWMRNGGKDSAVDDEDYSSSTTFSVTSGGGGGHRCTPEHVDDHAETIIHSYRKIHGSLAVVKDSDDPYNDFRQSMLQMILENRIYSRNSLRQLLHCFLQLNSAQHHEIIIRAFMEIWNGGVAAESGA